MPCAPSPPSTFCQLKVTTSSLSHGRAIANAAEVASQIVRPARLAGMAAPSGTRQPEVVPFQVNTTSRSKSTAARSTIRPYGATVTFASSFNCLTTSVTQPAPNDSQASISTGRAPSSDHSAISTAPVSEAGTMAMR